MIEIIDTGHFSQEKKRISDYYQNTDFDFRLILGNPHKLIIGTQTFTLNLNSETYQRLISPKHTLISAIGKKPLRVLDAFGGMGKDGFILSHHGHHVTTYEINPVLHLLLSQALENYPKDKINWEIKLGDVSNHLSGYDVIYLDPMFEIHTSSKPKLAMQVIQNIVIEQNFQAWTKALQSCQKLVIKQHILNPPIASLPKPSDQVKGKKNVRYDIYY